MGDVFAAAEGPKRRPRPLSAQAQARLEAMVDAAPLSLPDRNRRLLAERLGWPDGAAVECERIEHDFPGFEAAWFGANRSENPVFNRKAGFYAWRRGEQPGQMRSDGWHGREERYGSTAGQLRDQLGALA